MNINILKSLKTKGFVLITVLLGVIVINGGANPINFTVNQPSIFVETNVSASTNTSIGSIEESVALTVEEVITIIEIFDTPAKYFSIASDNQNDFKAATFQYINQDGILSESAQILEGEDNVINNSGIFHSELIILPVYAEAIQINGVSGNIEVFPVSDSALSVSSIDKINLAAASALDDVTNANGTGTADSYYINKLFENMDLDIVTRNEWGAEDYGIGEWSHYHFDTYRFVVHHTAGNPPGGDIYEYIRAIHYYHGVTRGWRDIGYNYIIAPDGTIFEGHSGGIGARGTHAIPNSGTIGISVMGDYQTGQPPQAALDALGNLIGKLGRLNDIEPVYYDTVVWHNLHDAQLNGGSAPTACAGQYLISKISDVTGSSRIYYFGSTALVNNNNLVSQKLDFFGRGNIYDDPARVILDLSGQDLQLIDKIVNDQMRYEVVSFDNNIVTLLVPSELLHQTLSEIYLLLGNIPTQIDHMGYVSF